MKSLSFLILILVVVFAGGCHSGDPREKLPRKEVDLTRQDDDFVIPSSVWVTLEKDFPDLEQTVAKKGEKEGGEESAPKKKEKQKAGEEEELLKRRPSIDPLSFTVLLLSKSQGVLFENNFEIKMGPSGGIVDFKDYVVEKKKGTFFLKVKYGQDMDPKTTKVFFLSNSPIRSDVGMGSGCNTYFDITKYWDKAMDGEGLALNTTDFRHLSLTTGTFLFVAPFNGKLRLGRLTLKDSRYRELACKS